MRLLFRVNSYQRVLFTENAVAQMLAYRQSSSEQPEAGGVLLGRHLADTWDMVVDEVTVPQCEDERTRFTFFRSRKHDELARTRWKQESQTLAYLGLWHTHPEVDPVPSGTDRRDWRKAVANDTFAGDRLFFPIIGTKHIRVWTKSRMGYITELSPIQGASHG